MAAKDEDVVALKEQVAFKDTTVKKKNEVTDAMSQRGEKIMVKDYQKLNNNLKLRAIDFRNKRKRKS